MAETSSRRKLPPIADYQTRCTEGARRAIRLGEDVLVEAPTGAGKTPMIARIAGAVGRSGGRALVLTHRKLLFNQMVGRPDANIEKKQMGEIYYWGGEVPGTIADSSMGGTEQGPSVVVGMVESVASRIDELANYDVVLVDEAHHASEEAASREEAGAYAKVLEALPDASLVGFTATNFRGDGDKLHPRLERAHREVVAIEEARDAGRIVPARTYIGKAPTESGRTAAELVQLEAEGRLERSASAILKDERGDAYYDHVVEDWDRIAQRRKTIAFVDSVDEVKDVTRRFCERYGEGVAVCIHGGKNPDGKSRSAAQNSQALAAYDGGEARVLIACQMIGEGFDVPETDAVMSLNSSLSRQEMNQYVGRSVRSAPDKEYGLFLDYGTASHRHGLIEHQHEMQNIDALAAAGTKVAAARAVGRMAPAQEGNWRAVPGAEQSLFLRSEQGRYEIYHFDHRAEKAAGRRVGKKSGSVTQFKKLEHPVYGKRSLSTPEVAKVLAEHARAEAGYYAKIGGVGSKKYRDRSEEMLSHWKDPRQVVDETMAKFAIPTEGTKARKAAVAKAMGGGAKGALQGRMLEKALGESKSGFEMVTKCLDISGDVLAHCANRPDLPFGIKAEAREVMGCLTDERFQEMKPAEIRREALATSAVMRHLGKSVEDKDMAMAIGNVAGPLDQGIARMTREMAAARRKRTAVRT